MCVPSGHTDWGRQKNLYVYHALSHALAPWTRGIFFRKKTLRESDRQLRYDF